MLLWLVCNSGSRARAEKRTFLSKVDMAWQQAGDALVVPMAARICAARTCVPHCPGERMQCITCSRLSRPCTLLLHAAWMQALLASTPQAYTPQAYTPQLLSAQDLMWV